MANLNSGVPLLIVFHCQPGRTKHSYYSQLLSGRPEPPCRWAGRNFIHSGPVGRGGGHHLGWATDHSHLRWPNATTRHGPLTTSQRRRYRGAEEHETFCRARTTDCFPYPPREPHGGASWVQEARVKYDCDSTKIFLLFPQMSHVVLQNRCKRFSFISSFFRPGIDRREGSDWDKTGVCSFFLVVFFCFFVYFSTEDGGVIGTSHKSGVSTLLLFYVVCVFCCCFFVCTFLAQFAHCGG